MKKNLFIVAMACIVFFLGVIVVPRLFIVATTEPAYAYMQKDMEEQVICARKAGFDIYPPTIRVMKPAYVFGRPDGYADGPGNIILLAPYASYDTIGHELGHIINFQRGWKSYSFFKWMDMYGDQGLADTVRDAILEACNPAVRTTF